MAETVGQAQAMNILHITPSYFPATFWGGPIHSVYGLCNALATIPGAKLRILTTDSAGPSISDKVAVSEFPVRYPAGYEVYFCKRVMAASVSPGMFLRLWPMIRWADVVHLTAVYSAPTIPTLVICRLLRKPLVWSPRGALQRWDGTARQVLKRGWESLCNVLISPKYCILHTTSEEEATASQARISRAEIQIVPNGIDIPDRLAIRDWLPGGVLRLLYIGRLHPIKGIENLLRAVKSLSSEKVILSICGVGDESYSDRLRQLVGEMRLEHCVTFRGHVEGAEKTAAFAQADVCVVPSFTENFGMVVAEALGHGVPVIVSKGAPWADVEKRDCGLWVENAPAQLASAITRIRNKSIEEMGTRGRNWIKERYAWGVISEKMFRAYGALIRD